jgi:rhodanese-related sulfurtransferase
MSAAKQLLDHKLLKSLSPLCDLTPDMLAELSSKSRVEQLVPGATIFKRGERDHRTLYLLSGKLELTDASGRTTKLAANSKQAHQPLDPETPRTITAVAKTPITLLNVDTGLLEMLLNWGGKQSYEVSHLAAEEGETDWMTRFLQSKVFLKLRAENIQSMMMRMEEIAVSAGDVIIQQDANDDNYYIIAKGRAKVARRAMPSAPLMKLAILTAGTGFGEESLISHSKRNASVTMMEDGCLMRLSKDDFINLLVTPVLQYVSYDEARQMSGPDVEWLDVRKLDEFSRGSLPDARNTPLAELRLTLRKLNKLRKYIVFGNAENRSAAAVFLLNQNGLDAFVLSKGLDGLPESVLQSKAEEPTAKQVPVLQPEDNVVSLRGDTTPKSADSDGRVEALMSKAKQRVQQEMQRTLAADNARKQAQAEVARLKAEAEAAREQIEKEAHRAADQARTEVERVAAQKRAEEMAREQSEREAAVQRAQAEAARAELAEIARQQAESEIEQLKQEAAVARREMEEQTRRSAENIRQETENEIVRLKAEAEVAQRNAEEQARLAADKVRSEAERELAQQRVDANTQHQQQIEDVLKKAELEAMRAQQAEAARQQAEEEAERMRQRAEETQREMEEQARLAADQARSEVERDSARQRAESLAEKQDELENAVGLAEAEAARAQAAETEVERLKRQAEEARLQSEAQASMAADAARSEVEREMAAQRAEEMARQQADREEMARRAEDEAYRAKAAEQAQQKAEAEIQRLKVDAEVARMQLEEQAQRVANAARTDAEREATRAQAAEEARLQAVAELERLETETEQTRLEAEAHARMAADAARSEAERAAASLRAEELAHQQKQLEEIASRVEEETERAQLADEARQRAENEILRRQQEAEEAERRAEEEAQRAKEAEAARQQMELEMAQLRAEAAAAKEQIEKQARLFAAAQRLEAEEVEKDDLAAFEAERKQREAAKEKVRQQREVEAVAERQRLADEAATKKQHEVDEAARTAAEEAAAAQAVAEQMRREAEEEILRLKAQAEAARSQAEVEVKRSLAVARCEVDQKQAKQAAQAKARKAAAIQQRKQVDTEKARRAREAREAALSALGQSGDGLDEFLDLETAAAEIEVAADTIIVDEAQIEARAKDRENLIDPTEVMKVEKQERKRHWVSDEFIWEATLGYRNDPNVEAVGSPVNSVGAPENAQAKAAAPKAKQGAKQKPEQKVKPIDKPAQTDAKSDPDKKPAMKQTAEFLTQEIDRTLRPQADIQVKRHKKGLSIQWIAGAAMLLLAVTGGGWFYLLGDDAPAQLKQVVDKGVEKFSELTDKVSASLKRDEGGENIETAEAEVVSAPPVNEGKMARLRQRLEEIKAKSKQAAAVKNKIVESPQAAPAATKPEAAIPRQAEVVSDENKPETVNDVLKALSVPEAAVPEAAVPEVAVPETDTSETGLEDIEVVESVDNLPIVDEPVKTPQSTGQLSADDDAVNFTLEQAVNSAVSPPEAASETAPLEAESGSPEPTL